MSCKSKTKKKNVFNKNKKYSFIKVEATDDDCANSDHHVCDYQITTPNVPFSIDSNGSISIKKPLIDDKYEFDVVAFDCFSSSADDNTKMISEPAKVTIKIVKSCKPTIKGIKKKDFKN
jgi:hypothetical protein